jgi:D-galacturonate reductase
MNPYTLPEQPLNLILIGSGHYATGQTALSGQTATDKDFGVLLPSALHLRARGWVGQIALCGRDGNKFAPIRAKIERWRTDLGIDVSFDTYPAPSVVDAEAYVKALDEMPRPCAALIAVPDDKHVEVMLACTQRNIPFLIVKPAVTRLEDFYEVKAAMPEGMLGMVDYHKVYDEANLLLLDDISQGTYGKIHHVSSLMSQRRDMIEIYQRWLRDNPSININHYLGSHYIHMTGFLTGARPIDVRATQQFGFIQRHYQMDVADTIQTQIRWRLPDGHVFASHHIAGWADPSQTESMTFQQMHLLTESGHVFSEQRYRGTRKVLAQGGLQAPNPYFFNFSRNLLGGWNLETKYGYQSVAAFVQLALSGPEAAKGLHLPSFAESEYVTAVLEAADLSLRCDAGVIRIERDGERLILKY